MTRIQRIRITNECKVVKHKSQEVDEEIKKISISETEYFSLNKYGSQNQSLQLCRAEGTYIVRHNTLYGYRN